MQAGVQTQEARLQLIGPDGSERAPFPPELSPDLLVKLYRHMVRLRLFDRRAVALQRQGRIGTYAPVYGQEAAQVGAALALEPQDWLLPTYRDHGVSMARGLPLPHILLFWMGREEGNCIPPELPIFPVAVSVGAQLPHATGLALAARLRGDPVAVLVCFGDGATSEGDFHEALNFAGVFAAPVVFYCQNNQFAISVPVARQTAAPTLAGKASAYGFGGVQVDGNDAAAVYVAVRRALAAAREGGGPTLIEAVTYRLGPHTTSDDPNRYRPAGEARARESEDPVERLRRYLERRGLWDADRQALWEQQVQHELDEAVRAAEAMPPPQPESMFAHAFAAPPPRLMRQLAELLPAAGAGGASGGGEGAGRPWRP